MPRTSRATSNVKRHRSTAGMSLASGCAALTTMSTVSWVSLSLTVPSGRNDGGQVGRMADVTKLSLSLSWPERAELRG